MGVIDEKYKQAGGEKVLGKPKGAEFKSKGGKGRHFERGSIFYHPDTNAHVVLGKIRQKYRALGWEKSELGFPVTDETDTPQKLGRKSTFQHGLIAYKWNTEEAFEVRGAIRNKYANHGGTTGFLGFPTTDETGAPDGAGRFNHFEGGSIYWKETIGAHEVHGLIRKLWSSAGWETNPNLGYPISDEIADESGKTGSYSDFENGVVYWRSGKKDAFELSKLDFGQSKTADEMFGLIFKQITTKIKDIPVPPEAEAIKITSGPAVLHGSILQSAPVTDYRVGKTRLVNRRYSTRTSLEIVIDNAPDIEIELDLYIEIFLDRKAGAVKFKIDKGDWRIDVPWPTSTQITAKEVSLQLKQAVDNIKPGIVGGTDGANVLSVKTMTNGDLNVYIEPLL